MTHDLKRLSGPVDVGDRLVWAPLGRFAHWEKAVVLDAYTNSDGERWLLLGTESGKFWNEEDNVRDMCIRP